MLYINGLLSTLTLDIILTLANIKHLVFTYKDLRYIGACLVFDVSLL